MKEQRTDENVEQRIDEVAQARVDDVPGIDRPDVDEPVDRHGQGTQHKPAEGWAVPQ
jgi:hypothetical protein